MRPLGPDPDAGAVDVNTSADRGLGQRRDLDARGGLRGPPEVWVDAAAFAERSAARLEEALALCRGELLAGLDEEWVFEYRDAHRQRQAELLERMAVHAEAG